MQSTTMMWVISEMSFVPIFLGAFLLKLALPLVTRTLSRTPLVQNTIDECFPPLLSSRIWNSPQLSN